MRQLRAAARALQSHHGRQVLLARPPVVSMVAGRPLSTRSALSASTCASISVRLPRRGFASSALALADKDGKSRAIDMDDFPPERIR